MKILSKSSPIAPPIAPLIAYVSKGLWSGDAQLWWVEAKPGDRLSLPSEVGEAGAYELVGFFTRAQDYGIIRIFVNGRPLGPLVDGYDRNVVPTGPMDTSSALTGFCCGILRMTSAQ